MKERPILFSAPEVRALLEGRKTQTRCVLVKQPTTDRLPRDEWECGSRKNPCPNNLYPFRSPGGDHAHYAYFCPYGVPGDQLWVREAWTHDADSLEEVRAMHEDAMSLSPLYYRASMPDEKAKTFSRWRPSICMPRWASRITLEITEVRVQRLQEISEDDARAEGVEPYTPPYGHISPDQRVPGPGFDRCRLGDQPHRLPFADLWDVINGKRRVTISKPWPDIGKTSEVDTSASWSSNPWVWALTFRRIA